MNEISNVSQADYMQLFMKELTYQDPLKPVDNREFMAQMAQFSALQQAQASNDYLNQILHTALENKGLLLLGKMVKVSGSDGLGTVTDLHLDQTIPTVDIKLAQDNGGVINKPLNEVVEVQ